MGNIKDEIRRTRQPRTTSTYRTGKCPKCGNETLEITTKNRINHTHGKYSKTLTPITEKAICHHIRRIKTTKGEQQIPCGHRQRADIRRGQQIEVGE